MRGYDPYSPTSNAQPPTEDVEPVDFDEAVEADDGELPEGSGAGEGPDGEGEAPGAPEGADAPTPPNDAPEGAEEAQTPAEGDQGGDQPEVKVGTAKEVMDWVLEGEDDATIKARAQAAYDAEQASNEPRKGLSGELEELLSDDSGS